MSLNVGRFDAPPELPADICLYVQDIDHAYWNLFFRDDAAHDTVWYYLRDHGYRPAPFQAWPDEKPQGARRRGRIG